MEASDQAVVYDDYCFVFPLWTLVNTKSLKSLGLTKSLAIADYSEQVFANSIALFTEEELADRFVAAKLNGDVVPLKLNWRHELEQLLLSYCRQGGEHIAVDPTDSSNSPNYRQLGCPAKDLLRAVIKSSADLD
jgi:hypothetical protein